MSTVPAAIDILRFRGALSRTQYWAGGLAVVVVLFWSWVLARVLGSATDSVTVSVTIGNIASAALIYAVTALTVARLRHLGASLWWVVLWPLTAPVFWLIVGLLTPEAAAAIKTLLTLRDNVARSRFWTVGGWLFLAWGVWFYTAALLGIAGGWFPTFFIYAWLAFTPFALYVWSALLVGRLRNLGASLWWMVLWPPTLPVFWVVVGLLPRPETRTTEGAGPRVASEAGSRSTQLVWDEILRFKGKANRLNFWVAGIVMPVVWMTASLFIGGVAIPHDGDLEGGALGAFIIWAMVTVGFLYLGTALAVARLRDVGLSLWWMVAWPLTAPVFWVIAGLLPTKATGQTLSMNVDS